MTVVERHKCMNKGCSGEVTRSRNNVTGYICHHPETGERLYACSIECARIVDAEQTGRNFPPVHISYIEDEHKVEDHEKVDDFHTKQHGRIRINGSNEGS